MTTNQTLFFTCPHCEERSAQIEEPDKDVHTGESYHCNSCGVQVIFQRCPPRTTSHRPGRGGTATSATPNPASSAHQYRPTMRKRDVMRLAAQSKGGFYPTPERVVDFIASLIRVPSGSYYRNREALRILDPCCGAGEAAAQLAERLASVNTVPIETYGVELHQERAEEAAGRLRRTLAADLFQTSIGNQAFGVCFLNPPYDHDPESKRTEHAFLTHVTRYLDQGGLLVFIVPRQRLAVSAKYLASYYARLRCWAFPHPEREAFDQVVVMGYRQLEPHLDVEVEREIREWSEGEPRPLVSSNYPVYTPSTADAGDILFATRNVDPVAAAAEARRSGLWGQRRGHRRAVAQQRPTHPSTDAAPSRTHGHAHRCRFPGQPPAPGRRSAHPGQGEDHQGAGPGGGDPR